MLALVVVVLAAGLVEANPRAAVQNPDGRIIGGEEAPKHAFPWQISLRSLGSHTCGGAIINQNQVLTAAHCVEGFLPVLDKVIAGAHFKSDLQEFGHQRRNIKEWEAHESHNEPPFDNDIAIITVSEPFDFSDPNVQPIEYWTEADGVLAAETVCNSTGWGLTSGTGLALPNALQWIQIPVHSTCSGDSGGPFVCPTATGESRLTGLVSFGYTGCTAAGVYANVVHFQDWIEQRLNP